MDIIKKEWFRVSNINCLFLVVEYSRVFFILKVCVRLYK